MPEKKPSLAEEKVRRMVAKSEAQAKGGKPRKASLEARQKLKDLGITPSIIKRSRELTPLEREVLLLRLKIKGSWVFIANQISPGVNVGPDAIANTCRTAIKKLIKEGLVRDPSKEGRKK